jgi:hypothetical protein
LNLLELVVDVGLAAAALQEALCLIAAVVLDEPAWRLRYEQHRDRQDQAGSRSQAEHPTPAAGYVLEYIVDQVGDQDPERDSQLGERGHAPTQRFWRVLADVHRRHERGGTHRKTEDGTSDCQQSQRRYQRRRDRGERVDDTGGEERPLAPDAVGEVARHGRAGHRAE